MPIKIFGQSFSSQKKLTIFIRDLLSSIGCCESVFSADKDSHSILLELIKRHPSGDAKIYDVIDFAIRNNRINRSAFDIVLIRKDNSQDSISWPTCVSGNKDTIEKQIIGAMRNSIHNQIWDYKKKQIIFKCQMCDTESGNFHVDHIIHFEKLRKDFQSICQVSITSHIESDKNGLYKFSDKDIEYEKQWNTYHKDNAQLRILCQNCNLTRSKI